MVPLKLALKMMVLGVTASKSHVKICYHACTNYFISCFIDHSNCMTTLAHINGIYWVSEGYQKSTAEQNLPTVMMFER